MVTDLHVSEKGELYVGGLFRLAGGKPSNNIAVWLIDGDADGHPDRDDVFPFDPRIGLIQILMALR
ncbi:MAG: hypothetical protein IPK95_00410 [Cellvibrionales bacterium]|nr:hypothetical protein [Cellvibrionales bacterium]